MTFPIRLSIYMLFAIFSGGFSLPVQAASCGGGASLPPELSALLEPLEKSGSCKLPVKPVVKNDPLRIPLANGQRQKFRGTVTGIQGAFVPDEVLVFLRNDSGAAERLALEHGLTVRSKRVISLLGGVIVRFGIADGRAVSLVRAILAEDEDVVEAVPNHIYELNGSISAGDLYSLAATGINKAHKLSRGRGVKIAIIDTAIDDEHPALLGAVRGSYNGLPDVPLLDKSHGTVVALLAAGALDPFLGAAPEAEIYAARAFDISADGKVMNSVYSILQSLNWAMWQQVDIVNMSFAGPENKLLSMAVVGALERDVIVVAAAGNGGKRAPFAFPAAVPGVIAVTATDAKNRIYSRANQGAYISLAAPGVDLIVPEGDEKIGLKSGTSFGAAIFSGIAALALEGHSKMPLKKFREILKKSVQDLGPPGRDKIYGLGLIKADELIKHAGE